jgi:ACS family glucarate transporter-like MFS transporter
LESHRENPYDPALGESALPGPTNIRWLMFALASGTSWFLYLHRYTWNIIRPELISEYGFTNTEVDSVFALFNFSYALGQIPGGVVSDYFGPHLFLTAIIVLWSLLLPCFGLTSTLNGIGALRLAFGAAQAGCYPALSKVTRVWFPFATRTTIQGFVASFFGRSGGAMSSIIMATVLMGGLGLSWQMALSVMAAAGGLFALAFLLLYRNRPEDDRRVNEAEVAVIREGESPTPDGSRILPFIRVIRNRSMLVFIFQQMLNAGADGIYVYLMGSYFAARGFSVAALGLIISLPLWGGAFGGVVGGIINDALIHVTGSRRWSRTAVGFSGKFAASLFMFVAISQQNAIAAAWWLFVVKFFSDWTQPTVWGTCTDMGGRYSATTFSIINTAGSVGGIVTPLAFALVLDRFTETQVLDGVEKTVTNYTPILVIVAGMYLTSAVSWFFINCNDSLEEDEPKNNPNS